MRDSCCKLSAAFRKYVIIVCMMSRCERLHDVYLGEYAMKFASNLEKEKYHISTLILAADVQGSVLCIYLLK